MKKDEWEEYEKAKDKQWRFTYKCDEWLTQIGF
jgi:hypothetical protein